MGKWVIGLDIGGTNVKAGLVDSGGNVSNFKRISTNGAAGFSKSFAAVLDLVEGYINKAGRENILGIGCACTGQIDHLSGKVIYAAPTIPELWGFEVKKGLMDRFGMPVEVENDVNAFALGEKWMGAGQDLRDFICITLGTGVGGAIIRGGSLERGHTGIAAEFGHMILDIHGEPCSCGNRGCYERYAAVSSLIKHFKAELEKGYPSQVLEMVGGDAGRISGEILFEGRAMGDPLATRVVGEYIEAVAAGAVSLTHIFNPQAVIFGGGITSLRDEFMEPIRQSMLSKVMPVFDKGLEVRCAMLGDHAALCGMAGKFFSSVSGQGMDEES